MNVCKPPLCLLLDLFAAWPSEGMTHEAVACVACPPYLYSRTAGLPMRRSYRVVCKVERREARQLCQVRDIIGILQLISAQVERFKGLEVRQPRDRRDVVLRQIECVQLRQALQPADIDDRVTPKVQASQVHKMVQVFDGADCVLLQVQSLQAGVLLQARMQVLKLNYALALKVKHIIELWCRRVPAHAPYARSEDGRWARLQIKPAERLSSAAHGSLQAHESLTASDPDRASLSLRT
eukprot:366245-Chlamydomonas_euryale.AAC.18